jgi:putative restriction endonuclease
MTRVFGELEGFPIGSEWGTRRELSKSGVHKPSMNGISGTSEEGSDSIVISGGYEDDEDYGSEIIYTGTGGYDATSGKQTADQTLDNTNNAALVVSQFQGLPVRVIRGAKGDPKFSPKEGYRYDGLFKVEDHWSEVGKSGFRVWRFRLTSINATEALLPLVVKHGEVPKGETNPGRITSAVVRTIRNTAVAEYVKKLYGYKCQICRILIPVPKGFISEGAHIRALGKPHLGPDVVPNILCMCPNHHAEFDAGGIYIADSLEIFTNVGLKVGQLFVLPEHKIDKDSLSYHRKLWGKE